MKCGSVRYGRTPYSLGASNVVSFGKDGKRAGWLIRGTRHKFLIEVGTSLTELMFAIAAGFIVLGATLQSLSYFQHQFMKQQREVAQRQDLRLGLEVFEQELRLAEAGSLTTMAPDSVEFLANLQGFTTTVTTPAAIGQTALSVEDGRGWGDRKAIEACWSASCEMLVLDRDGQRSLLTVAQPLTRAIPSGASISLLNRVRYYNRRDDQGVLRLLRQVDGGASVLVGNIREVRFSYWGESGQAVTEPTQVRRVIVEVTLSDQAIRAVREISLRT